MRIAVARGSVGIVGDLRSAGDLVVDVFLRLAEFLHRLAEALGEFWELLCSEHNEYDEKYDEQVRAGKISENGESVHGICC